MFEPPLRPPPLKPLPRPADRSDVEGGGYVVPRGVEGGRMVLLVTLPLARNGVARLPSSRRPCALVAGQPSRPGVLGIGVAADIDPDA